LSFIELGSSRLNPFKALSKMLASLFDEQPGWLSSYCGAHIHLACSIQPHIQCNTLIYHTNRRSFSAAPQRGRGGSEA
jgi:hypothetical protein